MLTTIINAFVETLVMVLFSGTITVLFGLPLGFLLYCSINKHFFVNSLIHYFLRISITMLNTTPYLIITIFSIPLIKALAANDSPTIIAILPLTIATIPLFGALTFEIMTQLPKGLTDASKIMGASPWQTITKIYLPEMLPSLILALAKIINQLISYSTIAGLFGAGGIGALIMQKGYYSFEKNYVIACTLILIATIQCVQLFSRIVAKQIAKQ